jgi:prepilin peptidase CpaA
MTAESFHSIIYSITTAIVLVAALYDLKSRRIPNGVTVPAMVLGISLHAIHSGWTGLALSMGGLVIGGGVFLLLSLAGSMGAGDVKLMAGVGALLGVGLIISVLILTALGGGIIAISKIVVWHVRRRTAPPLRSGEENPLHETMPYGVAIAMGTMAALVLRILGGGTL